MTTDPYAATGRPYYFTMETPGGETVRAVIHAMDSGEWAVTIGGTIPRSAYTTWADTLGEAVAFVMGDIRCHLTDRGLLV
jgi:hypothetical protein